MDSLDYVSHGERTNELADLEDCLEVAGEILHIPIPTLVQLVLEIECTVDDCIEENSQLDQLLKRHLCLPLAHGSNLWF